MDAIDPVPLFRYVALATLLGLLVGLQRERTQSYLAGVRTFPLITVFGTLCAIFAETFGYPWMLPAGLIAVIGLIAVGNLPGRSTTGPEPGVTTEIAALLMFAIGAFVVVGPWVVAVALGGGVAILLHMKPVLHGIVRRLGDEDLRAIMQFVLISFIILPVIPNRSYDPLKVVQPIFPEVELAALDVLNPYETWLLVVLVVGISLAGYVTYKFFGQQAGTVLGGILGGTISSTATTVSYSRRTSAAPETAEMASVVIMIASTVVYIRILFEVAIVAPSFVRTAAGPILAMFTASVLLAVLSWAFYRHVPRAMPDLGNPTELKSAIVFALVYTVILLGVAIGKQHMHDQGLYAIAVLSGLTDMDAITLSTSRLVSSGRLEGSLGWRLVITAAMSNLVFKGLVVAVVGDRRLLRQIAVLFGLSVLSGAAVLLFWP